MSVPSIWSTEGAAKVGPGDAVSTSHDDGSIDHGVTQAPYERRFSPYDFNGGYVLSLWVEGNEGVGQIFVLVWVCVSPCYAPREALAHSAPPTHSLPTLEHTAPA